MVRLLLGIALAVTLCGCGDDPKSLSGSMCSIYDCGFNVVTIRQIGGDQGTTVQIDYTDGPVAEATARAAVVVCDVANFVKGQELPATDVRHVAPDGVGFPTMKDGKCVFDTELTPGETVSGSFHATFVTEAGTERALMGNFEGVLEVVQ
jgi:hypothetical protein